MYKRTKQYFTDVLSTLRAILATQTETLAELRTHTGLLHKRDTDLVAALDRVSDSTTYLARSEAHRRQQAGHPLN